MNFQKNSLTKKLSFFAKTHYFTKTHAQKGQKLRFPQFLATFNNSKWYDGSQSPPKVDGANKRMLVISKKLTNDKNSLKWDEKLSKKTHVSFTNKRQAAFLFQKSLPRNTCLKKRANTHISLTKQNTEKHISFTNKQQALILFQTSLPRNA